MKGIRVETVSSSLTAVQLKRPLSGAAVVRRDEDKIMAPGIDPGAIILKLSEKLCIFLPFLSLERCQVILCSLNVTIEGRLN